MFENMFVESNFPYFSSLPPCYNFQIFRKSAQISFKKSKKFKIFVPAVYKIFKKKNGGVDEKEPPTAPIGLMSKTISRHLEEFQA